jgi:hypothetical protein
MFISGLQHFGGRVCQTLERYLKFVRRSEACSRLSVISLHTSRLSNFAMPLKTLNDLLELAESDEGLARFVKNLKYSYTRTIVLHLHDISAEQFDAYVHYLILLMVQMKSEFEELLATSNENQ